MSEVKIITQQGEPVDEKSEEECETSSPYEDIRVLTEDISEGLKAFRKLRDSTVLKIGAVAVALKVIDVIGKIVMENQRLKSEAKKKDDEKS